MPGTRPGMTKEERDASYRRSTAIVRLASAAGTLGPG